MKKSVALLFIAILITGTVFAQDKAGRPNANNRQREINSVTIDGTLKLEKGSVAVQSGDSVYLVPLLNRYINFINGLKEGAKVSVEGINFRNFIMPKKVTIEGKSYDFIAGGFGFQKPGFNHSGFRNQKFDPRRGNSGHGRSNAPNQRMRPGENHRGNTKKS